MFQLIRYTRENGMGIYSMVKYRYLLDFKENYNEVVLDFSQENSLEFAYMISDPLGSDISWRFNELKNDVDNYIELLKGHLPEYQHGGNASSVISYRDITIIEDPFIMKKMKLNLSVN